MSRIVCLLEPDGPVAEFLLAAKREALEQATHPLPYADHPPHCTLCVGEYGDPVQWRTALSDALQRSRPFAVPVTGWRVFSQDVLAGGGDTLALDLEAAPELMALQHTVAEIACGGLPHPPLEEELPAALRTPPFSASWARFGFPFVGAHWLPHATVASFPAAENGLLERFRTREVAFEWSVRAVTVMRVVGDSHEPCYRCAIG